MARRKNPFNNEIIEPLPIFYANEHSSFFRAFGHYYTFFRSQTYRDSPLINATKYLMVTEL